MRGRSARIRRAGCDRRQIFALVAVNFSPCCFPFLPWPVCGSGKQGFVIILLRTERSVSVFSRAAIRGDDYKGGSI